MNNISRRGLVGLLDQGVTSGTTFLTAVLIGRFGSKAELGLYSLASSIVVFVMVVQAALVLTPYTIYSPRFSRNEHALYAGSTLIQQLGLSLLAATAIGAIILPLKWGIGLPEFVPVAAVLALVVGFILLKEFARRVCFANLEVKSALLIDVSVAVMQLGGLALLAYAGVVSARYGYLIIGCACAVIVVPWFVLFWEKSSFSPRSALFYLRKNSSVGKWMFLSGLAWASSTQVYPWFLGTLKSVEEVGMYGACLGTVAVMNPMVVGAGNIIEPSLSHAFASGGHQQLRDHAIKVAKYLCGAVLLLCVGMSLCGGEVVRLLYGSRYTGGGLVVAVLAFNTFVMSINFILSRCLFILDRAQTDFKSNVLSVGVSVSVGVALVYGWGALGGAVGLLLANICSSPVRYMALSSEFRRKLAKRA